MPVFRHIDDMTAQNDRAMWSDENVPKQIGTDPKPTARQINMSCRRRSFGSISKTAIGAYYRPKHFREEKVQESQTR